jgi:hypothetical protein
MTNIEPLELIDNEYIDVPTLQKTYDKIKAYFSQPNACLAKDPNNGYCFYRTEDGKRCAVGVLVPDDIAKKMDASGSIKDCYDIPELSEWFNDYKLIDFLDEIQTAHDESNSVKEFLNTIKDIADKHNLIT